MPAHHAERRELGGQHDPTSDLQGTLGGNGAADVARVALSAGVFDVLADGIQLDSQTLDVRVGQMCKFGDVGDRHRQPSSRIPTLT